MIGRQHPATLYTELTAMKLLIEVQWGCREVLHLLLESGSLAMIQAVYACSLSRVPIG